jgi:hypothetical protein
VYYSLYSFYFFLGCSLLMHGPTSRAAARQRQRRSRARRRQGTVVLHVEAHEFRLVDALLAAGRLSDGEGLDRRSVEVAVARVLKDFVERWMK